MKKLTIGTYNICGCRNFSNYTPENTNTTPQPILTSKAIDKIGADILGLNEVFCDGVDEYFKNQVDKLAILSGYPFNFYALGRKWDDIGTIGNGILSKYEIRNIETIKVDSIPLNERKPDFWYEERVILKATIDVDGKMVDFIQTHFGLDTKEAQNMMDKLTKVIDEAKNPIVLMGDFNFEPDNPILKPLFDKLVSVQKFVKNTEYTW
ncbi:MAG: endonuclease/exonuclease/phosphatase family protein, partial [Clostridia bacterium]|nr:endonuclease/exonuclease/phosphatase family protein [Clostridia bacterium]